MIDFGPALMQPNQQSCGASCVVVARLLRTAGSEGGARSLAGFGAEVLAAHRQLTAAMDPTGAMQLPWPRALGTPPWAVARALGAIEEVSYRTRLVRRGSHFDTVLAAVAEHPVALYIGSARLPRHVTLVIDSDSDGGEALRVYDPASGLLKRLTHDEFHPGGFRIAGWSIPWFTISP